MQNDLVRSMNVTYRNIIAVRWPQLMAFSINYATLFLLSALSIPLNFSRPRCGLLIIFGTRSECPAPRAQEMHFHFQRRAGRFLLRELSRNSFKSKTCFLSRLKKQTKMKIARLSSLKYWCNYRKGQGYSYESCVIGFSKQYLRDSIR